MSISELIYALICTQNCIVSNYTNLKYDNWPKTPTVGIFLTQFTWLEKAKT